jgi:protein subunit release factor B
MYSKWFKNKGIEYKVIHKEEGQSNGIQSIVMEIIKDNGINLMTEIGVHRLTRISPFDSNARRHTTYSAIDVNSSLMNFKDIKRYYVLHPYTIVKDLQTDKETSKADEVLAGDVDLVR